MIMEFFLQYLLNGASLGILYGISAMGFILIYRSGGFLNFAHGALMGFGAFLFFSLSVRTGGSLILSFIITLILSFALGLLIERYCIRPIRLRENLLFNMLMTLGLALMLKGLVSFIFGIGTDPDHSFVLNIFSGGWHHFQLTYFHMTALVVGIGVLILYWLFFILSPQGISMRAFAENQIAAKTLGIPVKRVLALSWGISAILCAATGMVLSLQNGPGTDMLGAAGLKVFPVIVLGGLNSIGGAILAGLIIGFLETATGPYISPPLQSLLPYMVLLLVLILKPSGFFGEKGFKKV